MLAAVQAVPITDIYAVFPTQPSEANNEKMETVKINVTTTPRRDHGTQQSAGVSEADGNQYDHHDENEDDSHNKQDKHDERNHEQDLHNRNDD